MVFGQRDRLGLVRLYTNAAGRQANLHGLLFAIGRFSLTTGCSQQCRRRDGGGSLPQELASGKPALVGLLVVRSRYKVGAHAAILARIWPRANLSREQPNPATGPASCLRGKSSCTGAKPRDNSQIP